MALITVRLDRPPGASRRTVRRMVSELMNLGRPLLPSAGTGWTPEADLFETPGEVFLVANLAGVDREHIDVSFSENVLRISGVRPPHGPRGNKGRYHLLEMGAGSFERVFHIPAPVDPDRITARHSDGLLFVRMGKRDRTVTVPIHTE